MTYKNPKQKPPTMKRESPQDLVIARNIFIKQHPDPLHLRPLYIVGFVIGFMAFTPSPYHWKDLNKVKL